VVASRDGVRVVPHLAPVVESAVESGGVVGIDMPIGLPHDRPRACDREARRFLGARRSSIFEPPRRVTLGAADHAEAQRRSVALHGTGLSVQAWNLVPKIREVDQVMTSALEDHVVEVSPECAVRLLLGRVPAPKRTAGGAAERRDALEAVFGPLPARLAGSRPDDVLDAYAVLWSAERFARGEHVTFGDGARDERGLLMRIVM
jgi:predicted RNase H-like nuclease